MPQLASDHSALINAEALSLQINGQRILDQVSLRISPAEFVTLVGPNGAGKSMLIKCLLGIITPDSGHLSKRHELKTAYVPQRLEVTPHMPISVTEFLCLKSTEKQRLSCAELNVLAQETHVEHLLTKPLSTLSGGEMQRVLLARALRNTPELLVLDEPAQNLDIGGQVEFYQLIEQLFKSRKLAVLMVSHDLHWVLASTQKVICLYHHVCCSGAPQAVAQHPEFISLFGKDLSKLMAAYPHHHDHQHRH